ncbi:hypothetical protein TIFTF001_018219 [Ficus carica]|uniref:Uncharacterized protein n=1 Tax=Ficus carica TaxID=3494 RepID=A0AA88DAJ3_FICCA|nr:hypothetical protein TIFTF001_018219 [Ficus carica]
MLPVLLVTFIPSITSAQSQTLFIKQGTTLDRSLGPHFSVPPASLMAFVTIFMLTTIVVYNSCFIPTVCRYTKNPSGIMLLQRFGIGLVLHIIISLTASFTKRKRLSVARAHGVFGKNETVPLTVFILLPHEFAILGLTDVFWRFQSKSFSNDQAPEGMKSLGASFFTTRKGVGNFLCTIILTTVSDITKRHGHGVWVLDNLNVSHLDYYYAFVAVLAFLNFLFFLLVAKFFVYNAEVKKYNNVDLNDQKTLQNIN